MLLYSLALATKPQASFAAKTYPDSQPPYQLGVESQVTPELACICANRESSKQAARQHSPHHAWQLGHRLGRGSVLACSGADAAIAYLPEEQADTGNTKYLTKQAIH